MKNKAKMEAYENFLHTLSMGVISCNDELIRTLVSNANKWSYMHRQGNGELSEEEVQRRVDLATKKLSVH